jgi:electron transport complex protein RnfG
MNEMLHYGLVLLVITVVASAALSLTYEQTKAKIESQQLDAIKSSLKLVMPGADDFKMQSDNYYIALSQGKEIGYVKIGQSPGYSSNIRMMIGVTDGKITGLRVLSQSETPGLGTRVQEPWFQEQFKGLAKEEIELKKNGGKIDAITGATISSKAVVEGVKGLMSNG